MIDVDMEALEDDGIVRISNAEFLTRPLRLTPAEALALIVALRALAESAGPRQREPVDRALAKIEAAAGERSAQAAAVDVQLDTGDPEIREAVDQALREGRQLHLTYYVASRDETTERVTDPLRLVYFEGRPYLEAWCHRAQETRLFRVDSITAAKVLDTPADPPADVSLLDVSQGAFRPDPDDPVAVLDLDPAARWVADYHPVESTHRARRGPAARRAALRRRAVAAAAGHEARRGGPRRGAGGTRRRRTAIRCASRWRTTHSSPDRRCGRRRGAGLRRNAAYDGREEGPTTTRRGNMNLALPGIAGLGWPELIIIVLVVLLLFGGKKLPEMARGTGRALRIFKAETKGLMDDDDDDKPTTRPQAPGPADPARRSRSRGRSRASRSRSGRSQPPQQPAPAAGRSSSRAAAAPVQQQWPTGRRPSSSGRSPAAASWTSRPGQTPQR